METLVWERVSYAFYSVNTCFQLPNWHVFYVLSLLKSLNNRIIQILNLNLNLTLKTNPNA